MSKEAKEKAVKNIESDFIGKGFKKLDSELIDHNPPKIKWGKIYQGKQKDPQRSKPNKPYLWNDKDRIAYLEKLAATMNHAADLIQTERNKLLEIYDKQEGKIEQMRLALEANTEMLQSEIAKMNAERQAWNKEGKSMKGADLKKYLKEVKA